MSSTKTTLAMASAATSIMTLVYPSSSKKIMSTVFNINAKTGFLDHEQLHLKYIFNSFEIESFNFV